MKKILLFTLFPVTFINAQINLDQSDFADGGDTIRMSLTTEGGLDFLSTGTNYIWDFSALQPNSQTVKGFRPSSQLSMFSSFIFGMLAPTNYKATYFIESTDIPLDQLSSFLPITISDVFQFTRVTSDSITSVGYSMVVNGTEIPFKSDTIEKRYDFPIQFGDITSSRGYTNVDLNPTFDAKWRQYRQHTSEVDGWGSITTPYGTFDALRINHEIHEIDSIYYGGIGIWFPLQLPTSHIYEWWAKGEKEPILRINTSTTLSTETITSVEYRDIYREQDARLEEISVDFKIYPNPVGNHLTVKTNNEIDKITIVDIAGKIVNEQTISHKENLEISTQELQPGFYHLKIYSGDEVGIKSFIKE